MVKPFTKAGSDSSNFQPFFGRPGIADPHVESPGQCDLVLDFIWLSFFFFLRTTHHGAPWRYPDELHPYAVREVIWRAGFVSWLANWGGDASKMTYQTNEGGNKNKGEEFHGGLLPAILAWSLA
jgi:hypothetical protein